LTPFLFPPHAALWVRGSLSKVPSHASKPKLALPTHQKQHPDTFRSTSFPKGRRFGAAIALLQGFKNYLNNGFMEPFWNTFTFLSPIYRGRKAGKITLFRKIFLQLK